MLNYLMISAGYLALFIVGMAILIQVVLLVVVFIAFIFHIVCWFINKEYEELLFWKK